MIKAIGYAYLPPIVFTVAALLALDSIHASLRDYLPKARQILRQSIERL